MKPLFFAAFLTLSSIVIGLSGTTAQAANANAGAPAQTPADSNSIFGSWTWTNSNGGLSIQLVMTISPEQVTATNFCRRGGRRSQITVSSPALVTADTVTIDRTWQNSIGGEEFKCNVGLTKATFHYSVENNQLLMLDASGTVVLSLNRM